MDTKKILIVGLIATSAGGWLQAETLTFGFATSPTSTVTFGVPSSPDPTSATPTNIGTPFSGSLDLSALTGPVSSATCNSCTLNFSTGGLNSFTDNSVFGVGSSFFYTFATGGSFSAVTGATGSLNNANPPGTSGAMGPSQTLATGSVGAAGLGGVQFVTDTTTMLTFGAPVSAVPSANLSTILAAFGLGGIINGGTLSFTVTINGSPDANGYFTGTVSGGYLSLNVVPEPSSILLIGLGLIGVAFIGRKRLLAHRP